MNKYQVVAKIELIEEMIDPIISSLEEFFIKLSVIFLISIDSVKSFLFVIVML